MIRFVWLLVFIQFTAPNGNPVYLNVEGIQAIQVSKEWSAGVTMITMSGGNQYYVNEPIQKVYEKVLGAARK